MFLSPFAGFCPGERDLSRFEFRGSCVAVVGTKRLEFSCQLTVISRRQGRGILALCYPHSTTLILPGMASADAILFPPSIARRAATSQFRIFHPSNGVTPCIHQQKMAAFFSICALNVYIRLLFDSMPAKIALWAYDSYTISNASIWK